MALVLHGERPVVAAASPLKPFAALFAWLVKARAAQAQRQALNCLLELDAHRLADLGINRSDLFDAMAVSREPTQLLAERRNDRSCR